MQFFVEQRQLVIAECARGQRDFVGLLGQRFQNLRMAVPLVHRRIGRQAVEIAIAFHVVDPNSLRALDHDVERMIIVSSILVFEIDKILSRVGLTVSVVMTGISSLSQIVVVSTVGQLRTAVADIA